MSPAWDAGCQAGSPKPSTAHRRVQLGLLSAGLRLYGSLDFRSSGTVPRLRGQQMALSKTLNGRKEVGKK
jgi:hypothetical protein